MTKTNEIIGINNGKVCGSAKKIASRKGTWVCTATAQDGSTLETAEVSTATQAVKWLRDVAFAIRVHRASKIVTRF